jgi:hypothetical protein
MCKLQMLLTIHAADMYWISAYKCNNSNDDDYDNNYI